ncbi:MAG: TIR domain-containing protein [Piscinibacter sp.]|uniref:TIR domain-containing protein n=1 Tax=Piscinibacter sp. TaxID=1903157 RepID=UPI0025869EA0|nr:TIR domain-containing protein [Piscinibacter sp.]MCW5667950.1 TIR domain-containing protein [Piscinibacter sp.]
MATDAPRVFVSYARRDGEAFARGLRERLAGERIALWRDREGLEGGRDWWLQITEALDRVVFLVLVMTPAALASELVRREWRYARQRGVAVYPVMAAPGLDFAAMPRWMRSAHFYDLDQEWPKFLADLQGTPRPRRVPFMVEDLPADHVPRRSLIERLVPLLVDRARGEPVARITALRGAGGYGKTALARAACHHEEVQAAFDDGILWVTLGENPGELTGRVEDLIQVLCGQRPGYAGLEAAAAALADLLAERELLIVIDDLWDAAHAAPFLRGGPRCARLVTTRNVDTLPAGTQRIDVAQMQRDEAAALLAHGLPPGQEAALAALAGRLGEWPLLIKLVNGALRERLQQGQAPAAALAWVGTALDKRGLTFFDARDAAHRDRAVAQTLGLSLAQLDADERARLDDLAVFPEDQVIPLATLARYWHRTGALDEFDAEALAERLHRLSLLLDFDPARRHIRLHDVIRRFLLERLGDQMPIRHGALLEALRPATGDWADLPPDEPYLWDTLALHLVAAGRADELRRTVRDLHYLAAKTRARHAFATEADLQAAEQAGPDDLALRAWRVAFVQCQHLLARCDSHAALHATLYGHLPVPGDAPAPPLVPAQPLPDLPPAALIRSLALPRGALLACAISPDGTRVAGAGDDGRIRLWDAASGRELAVLVGHTGWVRRLVFLPDGRRLASAGLDRRLRLWDTAAGSELSAFTGHTDGLSDCAVSADGRLLASASLDGSLRLWSVDDGACLAVLARAWDEERGGWYVSRAGDGHWAAVNGCALSADGRWLASASSDQSVVLWSLAERGVRQVLEGHAAAVNGCAFSPDGTLLASAGADGTLRLWRTDDGQALQVLQAQRGTAWSRCAFTPDGRGLIGAAADGRLLRWSVDGGAPTHGYVGHTGAVNDLAVSADGARLASAADDGSLRLWRLDGPPEGAPAAPRRAPSSAFAAAAGLLVVARSDGALALCDGRGQALRELPPGAAGLALASALAPDAGMLAVGGADGSVALWGTLQTRLVARLPTHRGAVTACAFDATVSLLASASADRTLRLADLRDRTRRLGFVAHRDTVTACAFAPDGQHVVSGGIDGTLRRWRVPAEGDALWEAWFAGTERLAADAAARRLALLEFGEHARAVNALAFAPDGGFLASASDDGSLRLWHWPDGRERQVLLGHHARVTGCAVHPGGRLIASVAEDGAIRIWQAGGGTLAALVVDGALAHCAWLDDSHLAVAGACGLVLLRWQG